MINWKTYELGDYHQEINLTISSIPHCMNRKSFMALPPDIKQALYVMLQLLAWENSVFYDWNTKEAVDKMKKRGIQMITFSEEELKKWRAPVQPVWDEFISANEAKKLPAKQCVEDLKMLREKYSKLSANQIRELIIKKPIPGIIDGI
jgi:TRAP-type C4-dicarboxylate transport system substrate-binding protein